MRGRGKGKAATAIKSTWPNDFWDSPNAPHSRPVEAGSSMWGAVVDALGSVGSAFGMHTVHQCGEDDKGWYCELSRYYSVHQMIVGLLVFMLGLAAIVYFGYRWWKRRHAIKARAGVALMLEAVPTAAHQTSK